MTDQLVHFLCTAENHQAPAVKGAVTVHESEWSFCPAAATEGHHWQRLESPVSIGDMASHQLVHGRLTMLKIVSAETGKPGGVRPRTAKTA